MSLRGAPKNSASVCGAPKYNASRCGAPSTARPCLGRRGGLQMFGVPEVVHSRGGLCMSLLQGIEVIVVGHGWRLAYRGERCTCYVVLMGVSSLHSED